MSVMREVAQLQESYQALVDEKRLSKAGDVQPVYPI